MRTIHDIYGYITVEAKIMIEKTLMMLLWDYCRIKTTKIRYIKAWLTRKKFYIESGYNQETHTYIFKVYCNNIHIGTRSVDLNIVMPI